MGILNRILKLLEDLNDYNQDNYQSNKELEDLYRKDFSVDTSFLRYSHTPQVSTDIPTITDKSSNILNIKDISDHLYSLFSNFESEKDTYLNLTNFKLVDSQGVICKFKIPSQLVDSFLRYLSDNIDYQMSDLIKSNTSKDTTQIQFKIL